MSQPESKRARLETAKSDKAIRRTEDREISAEQRPPERAVQTAQLKPMRRIKSSKIKARSSKALTKHAKRVANATTAWTSWQHFNSLPAAQASAPYPYAAHEFYDGAPWTQCPCSMGCSPYQSPQVWTWWPSPTPTPMP